ncbi:MAG: hypothetical protein RIS44_2709 [Pseudomonadota bacterium]|jgi:hypothetical protein
MSLSPPDLDALARPSRQGEVDAEASQQAPLDAHHRSLWNMLGVDSCRVWTIDMRSASWVAGRWMGDSGSASGALTSPTRDAAGPGVDECLRQWLRPGALPIGDVATRMLSPRRWLLFWRVDVGVGLLVHVSSVRGRTSLDDERMATMRLLCEQWMVDEVAALTDRKSAGAGWDRVERRSRGSTPRLVSATLAASVLCAAGGVWLAGPGAGTVQADLDGQRRKQAQLAQRVDHSILRGLSHVLAGGDYGELQELLTDKGSIGHLEEAVVVNARNQAVAQVGPVSGVRLGLTVPPEVESSARALALSKDGLALGRLLITRPAAAVEPASSTTPLTLRLVGALIALAGLAAATLLVLHLRRR